MMLKTGIVTQARMTSTRLPGKIMLPAGGKPMLDYHLQRLEKSGIPVFVATTSNKEDDVIEQYCYALSLPVYRGDEHHVLSRFYECAVKHKLDVVIRVTSDCPLIDGDMIRVAAEQYRQWGNPQIYYSNCLKRTFPRGFDFEIFSFDLLKEAFEKATEDVEREHVTPFINKNKSGRVDLRHFLIDEDYSNLRITLDTPEDYQLIKTLIEDHNAHLCDYLGIISIFENNPELAKINAHIEQKKF